jgi:serine/threonine protein kinase
MALRDKLAHFSANFDVVKTLGSGSFGAVYLIKDITTQQLYAVKFVELGYKQSRDPELEELVDVLMHRLSKVEAKCKGMIAEYYGYTYRLGEFGIVTEYFQGFDLRKYISCCKKTGYRISEHNALQLMYYVSMAVNCLHKAGIIHRDIKPENIMYDHTTIKVIDLDTSCMLEGKTNLCNKDVMTLSQIFRSPEASEKNKSHAMLVAGEVWALGVTFFNLVSLAYPYKFVVTDAGIKLGEKTPSTYASSTVNTIIDKYLTVDYRHRPTLPQLMKVIKQVNGSLEEQSSGKK